MVAVAHKSSQPHTAANIILSYQQALHQHKNRGGSGWYAASKHFFFGWCDGMDGENITLSYTHIAII